MKSLNERAFVGLKFLGCLIDQVWNNAMEGKVIAKERARRKARKSSANSARVQGRKEAVSANNAEVKVR